MIEVVCILSPLGFNTISAHMNTIIVVKYNQEEAK
jgi:hypothetical protein